MQEKIESNHIIGGKANCRRCCLILFMSSSVCILSAIEQRKEKSNTQMSSFSLALMFHTRGNNYGPNLTAAEVIPSVERFVTTVYKLTY